MGLGRVRVRGSMPKERRGGRPHCEAFPAFDVRAATRSWRTGTGVCDWVDETGHPVGSAILTRLDNQAVEFGYDFVGHINVPAGTGAMYLEVVRTRRNPLVESTEVSCPVCRKSVHVIYNVVAKWACRNCHDLLYLTQRVSGVNKLILERDKINMRLAGLQPGKRHADERDLLLARRLALVERLGADSDASLPQELRFRISAWWGGAASRSAGATAIVGDDDGAAELAVTPRPSKGLRFLAPVPPPRLSFAAAELVGTLLFHRSLASLQRERAVEEAKAIYHAWPEDEPRNLNAFAQRLAEKIPVAPLSLTAQWSEPVESVSDDGRSELSTTAGWAGWPRIWQAYLTTPWRPATRAILDDHLVTLWVRAPDKGVWDMVSALAKAQGAVERRLFSLAAACDAYNARALQIAHSVIEREYRRPRKPGRLRLVRQEER